MSSRKKYIQPITLGNEVTIVGNKFHFGNSDVTVNKLSINHNQIKNVAKATDHTDVPTYGQLQDEIVTLNSKISKLEKHIEYLFQNFYKDTPENIVLK
jgi:autotransporter adhesin